MRIVRRQQPLATLRVESLIEDLDANSHLLAAHGIRLDPAQYAGSGAISKDVNSSKGLTVLGKPALPSGWRDELPGELRDGLEQFCANYGYL
jgi:hypothetical protein